MSMNTYSMKAIAPTAAAILGLPAPRAAAEKPITEIIEQKFQESSPTLLIAQYGNVDRTFHKLGPSDLDVIPMLEELDRALERAVNYLTKAEAAVVILSDHGQHDREEPNKMGKWGTHGSSCDHDRLVPCTWVK